MHQQPSQWIGIAISLAVVAVILFIRLRRMRRTRSLKLGQLWIVPVLYGAVAAYLFRLFPPQGLAWVYCAVALAFGCLLGWYRGKMMQIGIDPVSHALDQKASPAAMLFIVLILAIRMGARAAMTEMGTGHAGVIMSTDLLVAFALGFLSVQRLEMFLRARRLLAAARAGQPIAMQA